jgi:hypothetical protein
MSNQGSLAGREPKKREEQVGKLGNMAHHKPGLTNWRGGSVRSGLVTETWHITIKDSLARGEEEQGAGW